MSLSNKAASEGRSTVSSAWRRTRDYRITLSSPGSSTYFTLSLSKILWGQHFTRSGLRSKSLLDTALTVALAQNYYPARCVVSRQWGRNDVGHGRFSPHVWICVIPWCGYIHSHITHALCRSSVCRAALHTSIQSLSNHSTHAQRTMTTTMRVSLQDTSLGKEWNILVQVYFLWQSLCTLYVCIHTFSLCLCLRVSLKPPPPPSPPPPPTWWNIDRTFNTMPVASSLGSRKEILNRHVSGLVYAWFFP